MLTKDKTYDLATWQDSVLNETFNGVRVMSIMDYEDARAIMDVDSRHLSMWPYVEEAQKAKYANDPRSYQYYRLQLPNGSRTILGEAWLNPTTIQEVSAIVKEATLTFASPEQKARFESLMAANGLKYQYK